MFGNRRPDLLDLEMREQVLTDHTDMRRIGRPRRH
jgi:hypothetical protein